MTNIKEQGNTDDNVLEFILDYKEELLIELDEATDHADHIDLEGKIAALDYVLEKFEVTT